MAPHSARKRTVLTIVIAALLAAVAAIFWVSIASSQSPAKNGAQPAALPEGTAMGAVELHVRDLDGMTAYYAEAVGLDVLSEDEGEAVLGLDTPLLRLTEIDEGEGSATPTEAGLYHSAILYPTASALAEVLMSIATVAPASFQGSADHAVSEAFYFVDPEGNGLELYIDRPRDEWVWEDGEVQMGSAALDPNAFIEEHLGEDAVGSAVMGHVHLKVGDLSEAEAFNADVLGFAVTARSDGALFYAADGYHHHVATNTWQSDGAGARTNPTGLGSIEVVLEDAAGLDALVERLDTASATYERVDDALVTTDPWGNEVRVVVA